MYLIVSLVQLDSKHDTTNYNPYVNNGKTVRTQMDLYINPSDTYLIIRC